MPSKPVYALRATEVFDALSTCPDGLSPEEVVERLSLYGKNVISEPPKGNLFYRWVAYTTHPMALMLWLAGLIALFAHRPSLGVVIWGVVLINATFSFWREHRAEIAVDALKRLLPAYARVARLGGEVLIPTSEIVPGDVLVLAEGDNIPADARVVEEYGLRTNNSTLTGESMPARKLADASIRADLTELERPNLVFAGTSVVSGTARAVVYATGMLTQFGRITNLTQTVKESPSLLQLSLRKLTVVSAMIALGLGVIIFTEGVFDIGMSRSEAFILAIGIIVAAVPEGLVPTVTLTLAMAVQRLAQRGVLVKQLSVVETLGTVSVICTDKSGTLTQNQMTVRNVWAGGKRFSVTGTGYDPDGGFSRDSNPDEQAVFINVSGFQDLQMLLRAAMLCNNSRLNPPTRESGCWTYLGDQTEAALRALAIKGGLNEKTTNAEYPRIHELPFDARRKRMSTIHRSHAGEIAFVKGGPKEVLQLCATYVKDGEILPLDDATRAEILAENDNLARQALRVLALAQAELPPREGEYTTGNVERNLTFLGLAAMMDPPRPEVAKAMKIFRSAGIRMAMITGDYGLTAESVARRVGMLTTASPRILTGADLDHMTDPELNNVLKEEVIFARMAPDHKLRLVNAFQEQGEIVAVIGDGVNDAPALRKADVGISMGKIGTDVAREAADVILMEDNFASVATAIEEGRAAFDNLRKFITYIFASNVPEITPFILTALFQIPLALTVTQILAIDLGTDLLPALALGMEKPEPDVMEKPPRKRDQPLVDRFVLLRAYGWLGIIETVLCYLGFFVIYTLFEGQAQISLPFIGTVIDPGHYQNIHDYAYILATTVFQSGVVLAQIGTAFACRTEKGKVHRMGWLSNHFLLWGIVFDVALLMAMIYIPPLARVFDHLPLPWIAWPFLLAFAPILYILEKVRKVVVLSIDQHRAKRREGVPI
jgi:potassium/sodium efflux P-type ATPase